MQKTNKRLLNNKKKALKLFFIILSFFLLQGCFGPSLLERKAMRKQSRKIYSMKVTGYCSCKKCCNWKRKWFIWPVVASGANKGDKKKIGYCADGTKAKAGTIAADTSRFPFGTIMHVPGYGWGEVHDVGSAIKGNHIDLFFDSHQEALEWGNRKLRITVYK